MKRILWLLASQLAFLYFHSRVLSCQGWTTSTFSLVPPSTNPHNKLNQRLLNDVLPHEVLQNISNIRMIDGGGRIVFDATESSLFQDWSKILSPLGVKSLRVVVAQTDQLQPHFDERDILDSLWAHFTGIPWNIYESFGNVFHKEKNGNSSTTAVHSSSSIKVRRYASCCVPKSQSSTTQLTHLLRQQMHNATIGEWTLLLFDHCCWLEWTLLVPPHPAATMSLPRPGCKRVEAWMLLQNLLSPTMYPNNAIRNKNIDKNTFVLLDPLCGKGTYLIEAATTTLQNNLPNTADLRCLGVDLSASQLEDAVCNIQATHTCDTIHLRQGNASNMYWLDDDSVDAIVTCPPFGIQFGDKADLPLLYKDWTHEWIRVLRPRGGRLILLVNLETQDIALRAIENTQRMVVRIHREPFRLGRLQATVIVADCIQNEQNDEMNTNTQPALRRFPWESSHVRESRAEWARLRTETLQQLVPYTTRRLH